MLYASGPSSTVAPAAGWSTVAPAHQEGQYVWQKTVTTFNNGATESSMPTCLSGADGEPATTLRIDSSRGTVFKNNAVSTVLSAVIYRGGVRITDMNALRSTFGSGAYLQWSWQRLDEERFGVISASDSRLINDGFSFVLSADDVDTKVMVSTYQIYLYPEHPIYMIQNGTLMAISQLAYEAATTADETQQTMLRIVRIAEDGLHVGDNQNTNNEVRIDSEAVNVVTGGQMESKFTGSYIQFGAYQLRRTADNGLAFKVKEG